MRLRDAVRASKRFEAEARDEDGNRVAFAKGASWIRRPANQRRRGDGLSVAFYSPRLVPPILISASRRVSWPKMGKKDRRRVRSWCWRPVDPLDVVDQLAQVARTRGGGDESCV